MTWIKLINNIFNVFFWTWKIITYIIAFCLWICISPFLYVRYKLRKHKRNGFNHPNFVFVGWIMIIDKWFINVIF